MGRWNRLWPNRTACDILEEMRKCNNTRNYAPIESLIEEMQIIANRMEAGLENRHDIEDMLKARSELKKEVKKLEERQTKLQSELGDPIDED